MRAVIVSILVFVSINAFAHKEYFYYLRGTLGNQPIALKIEQYDEMWFAKFFYTNIKKDIFMKGTCDSLGCRFSTYQWQAAEGKQQVLETLSLVEQPDQTWQGQWVDQNKKSYPLTLRPIKIDSIQHLYCHQPVIMAMDPYSYFRTHDLKFIKKKSEVVSGKFKIDWYKENISGLIFPRIRRGFTKPQRDSVNKTLESIHIKEVENYFSCGGVGHPGEYTLKTEFTFVSHSLIGLSKMVTYNCQSEQTNGERINLTLAVDNGHFLDLENIFWMGSGTPPPAESQSWYEYRYKIFGSTIEKILDQLYPEKMKPQEGCRYDTPDVWQFPTWYLTPTGLFVGSFAPGIDHSCDAPSWSIIPFEKLKVFTNPKFKF